MADHGLTANANVQSLGRGVLFPLLRLVADHRDVGEHVLKWLTRRQALLLAGVCTTFANRVSEALATPRFPFRPAVIAGAGDPGRLVEIDALLYLLDGIEGASTSTSTTSNCQRCVMWNAAPAAAAQPPPPQRRWPALHPSSAPTPPLTLYACHYEAPGVVAYDGTSLLPLGLLVRLPGDEMGMPEGIGASHDRLYVVNAHDTRGVVLFTVVCGRGWTSWGLELGPLPWQLPPESAPHHVHQRLAPLSYHAFCAVGRAAARVGEAHGVATREAVALTPAAAQGNAPPPRTNGVIICVPLAWMHDMAARTAATSSGGVLYEPQAGHDGPFFYSPPPAGVQAVAQAATAAGAPAAPAQEARARVSAANVERHAVLRRPSGLRLSPCGRSLWTTSYDGGLVELAGPMQRGPWPAGQRGVRGRGAVAVEAKATGADKAAAVGAGARYHTELKVSLNHCNDCAESMDVPSLKESAAEAFQDGDFAASLRHTQKAIQLLSSATGAAARDSVRGELSRLHSNAAAALMELGDYTASASEAETAIELDPSWHRPYLRLCLALASQQRTDAATDALHRGLRACQSPDQLVELQAALQSLTDNVSAGDGAGASQKRARLPQPHHNGDANHSNPQQQQRFPPPASRRRVLPVTALCGFLGAGKTTLVQHVLAELGEGGAARLVVECTGVGEPAALAEALAALGPELAAAGDQGGVELVLRMVTVVDASSFLRLLTAASPPPPQPHTASQSDGSGAASLTEAEGQQGEEAGRAHEEEEYGIGTVVFSSRRPFHPARLWALLTALSEPAAGPGWGAEATAEAGAEADRRIPSGVGGGVSGRPQLLPVNGALSAGLPYAPPALLRSKGVFWIASMPQAMWELSLAGGEVELAAAGRWLCSMVDREHWPVGVSADGGSADGGSDGRVANGDVANAGMVADGAAGGATCRGGGGKARWHPVWGDRETGLVFIGVGLLGSGSGSGRDDAAGSGALRASQQVEQEEEASGEEAWEALDDTPWLGLLERY
eukprot:XP_001690452.1 predicted protein [Chlamydomonas reinhardtii]